MKLSESQHSAITDAIRDAFNEEQLRSWFSHMEFPESLVDHQLVDVVVTELIAVCEEIDDPQVWPLLIGALCEASPTNEKLAALARNWPAEAVAESTDEGVGENADEGVGDEQLEAARPPRPRTPPTMPPKPITPPAPTPSPVFPPPKPAPQPAPAPTPNPVKPGPAQPVPLPPVPAPRPVKPAKPQQQE